MVDLLNDFYSNMIELVDVFGGRVDKFLGDGLLAVFGLDQKPERAAEKAITCAILMQQKLSDLNNEFKQKGWPGIYVGIALHSGSVIACELGSDIYREFTVIGETVNITARVEAHSLRGQILITQATKDLAEFNVQTLPPETISIKGFAEPLKVYELRGIRSPRALTVPRMDERKYPRAQVHIPLAFRCISGSRVVDREYRGEILDLSYQGMKAALPVFLEPYSEITFLFSGQAFDLQSSNVYAKVIQSKTERGNYLSSMEFTSISKTGQQALRQYVDQLLA